jgi:hypothetical protein
MHMRMQVEPARVGVQHRYRAGFALELPVVLAEALHRRYKHLLNFYRIYPIRIDVR